MWSKTRLRLLARLALAAVAQSSRPNIVYLHSHDTVRYILPYGHAASFVPARAPRIDGDTWVIDIKRSDGVSRPQWNNGVHIKRINGNYTLAVANQVLDESGLEEVLGALGSP